jgi:NDP-sugar pyrophosphorylase family protein
MSGIGKRFLEAGYNDPKPLITVDGFHMIRHVVNIFPKYDKLTFICNDAHIKETNMREILYSIDPNCNIHIAKINNFKGPVDAVYQIEKFIENDEEVIISYCDYGTKWDYDDFLKKISDKHIDGAIPCYRGFHPHMLGKDNYAFV